MKTNYLLAFLLIPFLSWGQWNGSTTIENTIYRNGDVGLGTSTPAGKLHVKNGHLIIESSIGTGSDPTVKWRSSETFLDYFTISVDESQDNKVLLSTYSKTPMTFTQAGFVGIGTTSPASLLHVRNGDLIVQSSIGTGSDPTIYWRSSEDELDYFKILVDESYNNTVLLSTLSHNPIALTQAGDVGIGTLTPSAKFHVSHSENFEWAGIFQNNGGSGKGLLIKSGAAEDDPALLIQDLYANPRFVVNSNGRVGIGTSIPDALLAVKGKIHAEEVRLDLLVPGPDYVFENDYKLRSLSEVESFIKQNKHLPEIEPAKEMEKNGIDLGKMDMKLLQKVEELTLYMIDFQKQLEVLKEENKALKEKITQLEKD